MSRFAELFAEAIECGRDRRGARDRGARRQHRPRVLDRQGALRSHARIEAKFPVPRTTPVSGLQTQEIYTLIGVASATERRHAPRRRRARARAQRLPVRPGHGARAREPSGWPSMGYDDDERERILDADPDRDAQPARRGQLLVGSSPLHAGRGADRDRRELDVGADPRAAQAPRRAVRRRAGAPAPVLRRGLGARTWCRACIERYPELEDDALRARPPGELRDDPQPRRDRRADRASRRACATRCARRRGGDHLSLEAWLALA